MPPSKGIVEFSLTGIFVEEEGVYLAKCPELDIDSCGDTIDEAKANLAEAIVLELETAEKVGALGEIIERLRILGRYRFRIEELSENEYFAPIRTPRFLAEHLVPVG